MTQCAARASTARSPLHGAAQRVTARKCAGSVSSVGAPSRGPRRDWPPIFRAATARALGARPPRGTRRAAAPPPRPTRPSPRCRCTAAAGGRPSAMRA
eukprot:CAMPEP_0119377646 /NCGR_PEP_ID=MMETSP1334-20130426/45965_1 /TAXON_ID=127549 /ORGANISM="Calcidiscus leptoporus, Strain RCC1130" /LENGTH=97 /DNA_ID=CAMNT_0007396631 /DNA_START=328 /DNA_END=618 /DNA_ORIENTATION=+